MDIYSNIEYAQKYLYPLTIHDLSNINKDFIKYVDPRVMCQNEYWLIMFYPEKKGFSEEKKIIFSYDSQIHDKKLILLMFDICHKVPYRTEDLTGIEIIKLRYLLDNYAEVNVASKFIYRYFHLCDAEEPDYNEDITNWILSYVQPDYYDIFELDNIMSDEDFIYHVEVRDNKKIYQLLMDIPTYEYFKDNMKEGLYNKILETYKKIGYIVQDIINNSIMIQNRSILNRFISQNKRVIRDITLDISQKCNLNMLLYYLSEYIDIYTDKEMISLEYRYTLRMRFIYCKDGYILMYRSGCLSVRKDNNEEIYKVNKIRFRTE